jgi:hypothetical protein
MMSVSLSRLSPPPPSFYTQAQWQVVPLPGWERKDAAPPHWINDKYGQKVSLLIFDRWRHSSEVSYPRTNSVVTLCWCHLW